jgi:allantoinase
MWNRFRSIDTLGSDHSPAPPEMKISEDFFTVWGGISGCQHAFLLALAEWHRRAGTDGLARFSKATSTNVAARFGIGRLKGQIAEGFDADVTLVDLEGCERITAEKLLYRHPISPYLGLESRAVVKGTWVRGRAVYRDGKIVGEAKGRLVTPGR